MVTQEQINIFRQRKKAKGWSDEEINAAVNEKMQYESVQDRLAQEQQAQPVQQQAPIPQEEGKRNFLLDLLPVAGSVVGAVGGSLLAPGIGTIAGGGAGALAGEAIRQRLTGEKADVGALARETALGAIPVGKAFGVAGKIGRKVVGKALTEAGENIAVRALRPSKTQLFKFSEKHGEDVANVLTRHNAVGEDATTLVSKIITPLQNQFDDIARTSGVKVDPKLIKQRFLDKINVLKQGTLDDTKIAKDLELEMTDTLKKFGTKPVDISKVTARRKLFDDKVKDFIKDPFISGKNRLAGNALRESVQEAADKAGLVSPGGLNIKQLGTELSKLWDIEGVARVQENLGRGNLPLGLLTLMGGMVGGGAYGYTREGQGGAIKGIIAGALITRLAQTPKVLAGVSKSLTKTGQAFQAELPRLVSSSVEQILGQPTSRTIYSLIAPSSEDEKYQYPQEGELQQPHEGIIPSEPGAAPGELQPQSVISQTTVTGYTIEELANGYTKAISAGDTEAAKQIKNLYDLEFEYRKTTKPAKKTEKQVLFEVGASGAEDALRLLEAGLVSTGPVAGRLQTLKAKTVGTSAEQQAYMSKIALARSSVLNAFLGGNIPPQEFQRIADGIPTINDPLPTARQKLLTFIEEMRKFARAQVAPTTLPGIEELQYQFAP